VIDYNTRRYSGKSVSPRDALWGLVEVGGGDS
jgi:hypothetical protein